MASVTDIIQIIIEAEDRASATLKGIGDSVDSFASGIGRVTGPLASLTDGILKVDAAVVAVGAAFVGLALNESAKFADSLYLIDKQLSDTGPGLDEARAKVEELGLAYGINANEIARSMAGFLAAGNDFANSASLVETSTKLMIAGELEASFATDAITKSLAGFRVPAEDAAEGAVKVGDTLNKIGDISSGKFDEIVQGFARLAPTARDAGLSMEETAAMVAVLVDKFGSGEIAATALKSGFLSLLDPSKGASEELDRLKIKLEDATGAIRPAKDIMADLAKATQGQTDSQRLQTTAIIFGKEQAGAMNAILGDWAKSQDYLAQMMDKTTGAAGSMDREVRGKLELISTSADRAGEAWRQFLERVGTRISDDGSIQKLVDNVGSLGIAFKTAAASGALDPLIGVLQSQARTLSEIVEAVARNLPAALERINWSGATAAFGKLGASVSAIFDGIDLNTPEGLAKAIQAIVDTGESLIRITAGIVDGLKPFIRGLAEIVDQVNSSDDATKQWAGEILGLAKGINMILPAMSALGDGLSAVGAGLGALGAAKAIGTLTELGGASSAAVATLAGKAGLVGAAGAAGYAVGTTLADGIDAGVSALTGSQTSLGSWIYDLVNGAEDIESSTAMAGTALAKTGDAATAAGAGFEKAKTPAQALAATQKDLITANDLMVDGLLQGVIKTEQLAKTQGALVTVYDNQGNAIEKVKLATGGLAQVIRDADGNIVGYSQTLGKATEKLDKNAEATKKVVKESDEYRIKIAEIDATIKKAQLEAYVTIKTTQLQTDADRVKSTFESLDNTITNTGDLLGSLFDSFVQAGSLRDKWAIEDQIKKENKRRQDALDLQKQLTQAEIERIRAQTESLARGDATIKIDGTGLEPELEAFMWQILKRIRVRANAEFSDYLLGMAA